MKKNTRNVKKLFLTSGLFFLTLLSSCGTDDNIAETTSTNSVENSTKISSNARQSVRDDFSKIDKTTLILSKNIINLGVKEIIKDGSFFTLKTFKPFKIQDRFETLSKYEFEYSDNTLSFKGDNSYQIYSIGGDFYANIPNYNGLLSEINQETLNNDEKLFYILAFLAELDESEDFKTDYTTVEDEHSRMYAGGCSFFNTYYTVGMGLTAGAANANFLHNLWSDLDGEYSNHRSCRNLGGAESTHVGHIYVTSMAFCCT